MNTIDPFHVSRDVTRDNMNVVRRNRVVNGGRIRAQTMYASVTAADSYSPPDEGVVEMPYEGNISITVTDNASPTGSGDITVRNPFVTATTVSTITSAPSGSSATATSGVGQVVLANVIAGVYVLSVGNQTGAN